MIKIEFDFDLGNVPASAKKFADYLKGIETSSEKAKGQLKTLGNEIDKTADKMNKSGSALKKTNQQYMNLALVIQDLPYGFRGIQNNLPALLGGLAGVGGAAYLAFSAIIAGLTFWDEHNRKVTASAKKLKEQEDEVVKGVTNEALRVNELIAVLENETETRDRKRRAIKELQSINPDVFKDLKLEGDKVKDLNTYYNAYIENLKNVILLKQYEKQLEAIIQAELKTGKPLQIQKQKELKNSADLLKLNNAALKDNITTSKILTLKDEKVIGNINKYNISQQKKLDLLDKIRKLSPAVSLGAGGKDNSSKNQISKEKAANEAETKAFLESLDERAKKEYQAGLDLQDGLEKMRAAGFKNSETYYASYRANMLSIAKYYDDKEAKEQERKNKETAAADKVITDRNLQNSLAALKIQSDVETKILLKGGKSNAANRIKILEDYKNKLYDLASVGGYTAEQFDKIDDALIRVDAAIAGSADTLKSFKVSMVDVTNSLNTIINDVLAKLAVSLGESIGNMLSKGGGISDVINGFLGVLADGLIQVGQLAIATGFAIEGIKKALESLNPVVAIAAGIALVALGTYVKGRLSESSKNVSGGGGAKAFANGGIISGPTMGLMGEYPGAKSNPEVVAPLDKLKDMLGGQGGGQFILKGNDLVLALQRSNSSLNLRRGGV
jgi:hypothetical protein